MSTSDPPSGAGAPSFDLAGALTGEIQRLANQMFAGVPNPGMNGPAMNAPTPVNSVTPQIAEMPAPISAPTSRVLPSAFNVGAGGASPAVSLPPIPGVMHRPPLAAMPPPKESDLRAMPTIASELTGQTAPHSYIAPEMGTGTPYFLEIAGMPSAGSPSVPNATMDLPVHAGDVTSVPNAPSTPQPSVPISMPGFAPELNPESVPDVRARDRGDIFDAHAIKRDFPILRERVHGKPLVWLDNAATTQKPQSVIDRISYFYEHENSNIHRGAHTLAARATDAYEASRDKTRRFLNASSPKEIIFVRGATEGINLVAKSFGHRHVARGDEIVITWLEHHANIVPWQQLCAEKGARLRVAPVDDRGQVILEEYEKLLGPKTRIVSFTQVSNALGTVTPAREMIEMAHRHGARVHLDGAQAVSHMPVDVQSLDCDFYTFSGHKVFAPTGIGVVFGKSEVLETMPPWQGGGNMIADVTFEKTTYQSAPAKFEAGTGNIADAVGLGAAIDYVTALGLENVKRYEHELLEYAEGCLATVPGLTMIGTAPDKAGVMSFVLDGQRTEDVGGALDQEGIAVRSGHHCAQPILRRFGLESTVRASLAPYNTREDIDSLVRALHRLQAGRPHRS